ncbi:alpha/beta hydrolase [Rhodococcus sp. Z13]|uniref:Alpha/beta hydrolase n=1 Tax=Rhodococcus sacchari TaxID=2962047 RepID=A0ACD4DLI3_9NOCA|nr:alpha/beta hydrolase [Rhodococcus sp. Z13]UYP20563.1 alpha/beta hydrolase [Rhodococcus sp. Z13]
MTTWRSDVLGDGYEQLELPLGTDPDGEGEISATLVRYQPASTDLPDRAVLYVHGFTDYFFQQHLAEHFAARGYRFFALDLRKCGRSRRPGHTPHFVTDLAFYDAELEQALEVVRGEVGGGVLLAAHSTGGLVLPLWLDRLGRRPGGVRGAGVCGLVLNSPWFDLQGPSYLRNVGTALIDVVGRVKPQALVPLRKLDTYGRSLQGGGWTYDLEWKPLTGFPIRFGWLRAVRHGHARLHEGLDVGVPSLILRSARSRSAPAYDPSIDTVDAVLDVRQIARWAGCLGDRTTIVPIPGARHDVFLSEPRPLATAFRELDLWLEWLDGHGSAETSADAASVPLRPLGEHA